MKTYFIASNPDAGEEDQKAAGNAKLFDANSRLIQWNKSEYRFPIRLLAHCNVCAATVQITWMKLYATPAATISGRKRRGSVRSARFACVCDLHSCRHADLLYSAAQRPTWGLPRTLGRNAVFLHPSLFLISLRLYRTLSLAHLPFCLFDRLAQLHGW